MIKEKSITLPTNSTLEESVTAFVKLYNETIKSGHGLFLDLSNTPELEKPVLDRLINDYGWKYDSKNGFIRKPEE